MRPTGVFLFIEESAGVFTPVRDEAVKPSASIAGEAVDAPEVLSLVRPDA
jgi:hypothetical protein